MADADCHLLYGLIALQVGLIDQAQLVAAFQAWARDKARSLADHLAARGDLDADGRAAVEAMVALHLRKHDANPEKSFASILAGRSTRERLTALGDAELTGSLARLAAGATEPDPDRTASYAVGTATGDGQRFRVLRPHARGGLGDVFVALDGELHREVALKQILESHADDPASRQRFLLEAEITGGLEHPGIVPVYGLGTYGDGRPYYAMRFIRGDSLKEAIERYHKARTRDIEPGDRSLGLRQLLRQFTDVCNAIDYAHGRGVLHRDIKPGNVIVGKHGETLVVDWGLAKAMGRKEPHADADERTLVPSLSGGTVETLPGQAIGTPAFMSPEQARGDLAALGSGSDVYSLGATLYCLLTGRPPFAGDVADVLRAVGRGEFRPPRALDPSIDPALEAVCLKAMSNRPGDRYSTARALAEDIERWAADEPVAAWREPFARRARRWARRNRTAVTAAGAALVVGVVGLSTIAAQQARSYAALERANDETREALRQARDARDEVRAALAQSEESLKQAEAVGNFLVDALKKPDPYVEGKDVKVAEVLDQAASGLDKGFAGPRETEGALLDALGLAYDGLGLPEKAEVAHRKARAVREKSLGSAHRDAIRSANRHARALWEAGRRDESVALRQATLARAETALGPDDLDTLIILSGLAHAYANSGRAEEAIKMHRRLLAGREAKLGADHPDTLSTRGDLAGAYVDAGRHAEGIALHEATLKATESKLGADDLDTVTSRNLLALAYRSALRHAEAIPLHERNLRIRESKLGPDHPQTLSSRGNLALAYRGAGRNAEAAALNERNLKAFEARLGPDHPETLNCRNNLALAYLFAGRFATAAALNEVNLEATASKLGVDHPRTLIARDNLAYAYQYTGRPLEAAALLEANIKIFESKLGADHPDTLISRDSLARTYEMLGRWSDAEVLWRETVARRRRRKEAGTRAMAGHLLGLGRNLLIQGEAPAAEPPLRESLAICEKTNPDGWARFAALSLLGGSLLAQGRYTEAEPLAIAGLGGLKAREAKFATVYGYFLSEAADRVVRLYRAWGRTDQAETWARRLGLPDLPADVFGATPESSRPVMPPRR